MSNDSGVVDCRERQISAFSLAISLEMRPALLYGDMQLIVGRRLFGDPKMHDLE